MSRNRRGYDFRPMNELNEHGTLLGQVGYKPHSAVYVLAAAAVLFLLMRHLFGVIMALMCIAGALFIKLKVEDHPVMDVYDDAVIFYDPGDASCGIRYTPDQISKWTVNKEGSYQISMTLTGGDIHVAASYQVSAANRLLRKLMPEKSEMSVIQKSRRGFSFRKRK